MASINDAGELDEASSDSAPEISEVAQAQTSAKSAKSSFISMFKGFSKTKNPRSRRDEVDQLPPKKARPDKCNKAFFCLDCGRSLARGTSYSKDRHAKRCHANNKRYNPTKRIVRFNDPDAVRERMRMVKDKTQLSADTASRTSVNTLSSAQESSSCAWSSAEKEVNWPESSDEECEDRPATPVQSSAQREANRPEVEDRSARPDE